MTGYLYLPAVMSEATGFTTQTTDDTRQTADGGVIDDGTIAPAPAPEAMPENMSPPATPEAVGEPAPAADEAAAAPSATTQQLHLPLIVR